MRKYHVEIVQNNTHIMHVYMFRNFILFYFIYIDLDTVKQYTMINRGIYSNSMPKAYSLIFIHFH